MNLVGRSMRFPLRRIIHVQNHSLKSAHQRLRHSFRYCSSTTPPEGSDVTDMDLKQVVRTLHGIAPPNLAGSWDNVGLLVEPSAPHQVTSLLITNDLTPPVMEEAIELKVNMILSYHPPIFAPLKRLTQSSWKERLIVQCIENRMAVYAPHTALDAVKGGVNDWLLKPFKGRVEVTAPVYSPDYPTPGRHRLEFRAPRDLRDKVTGLAGVTLMTSSSTGSEDLESVCVNCTDKSLTCVLPILSPVIQTVQLVELKKPPIPDHGPGRVMALDEPLTIQEVVERVKTHLNLCHVRLAANTDKEKKVRSIAVCAGSGSSVFRGVKADLYVTGEMSHHEVLDLTARGSAVILCDHSNTERGYLGELRATLQRLLGDGVAVIQSKVDRDPLEVV